jgi:Bystin
MPCHSPGLQIIPSLRNWEEVLFLTDVPSWTPHAVFQATRLFVSSLNAKLVRPQHADTPHSRVQQIKEAVVRQTCSIQLHVRWTVTQMHRHLSSNLAQQVQSLICRRSALSTSCCYLLLIISTI